MPGPAGFSGAGAKFRGARPSSRRRRPRAGVGLPQPTLGERRAPSPGFTIEKPRRRARESAPRTVVLADPKRIEVL
jgi:hypothetical protein